MSQHDVHPATALPSRTLSRRGLPGPVQASTRLPWAETAAFVAVVPLLSVPALLASMGALWALGGGLVLTAAVAWLCLVRRVAVGSDWLADRRLWHYRITHASQLRAVDVVENAHGGLLRLHSHSGRAHRLRRTELASEPVRAAVSRLVTGGGTELGAGVHSALGLTTVGPAAPPRVAATGLPAGA